MKMKAFYEKYKCLLPFAVYVVIYLTWFCWLEERYVWNYHVIHTALDDYIPFCEYFIIPYFLWFAYVPFTVIYLAGHNREEYLKNSLFLITGMTVFLIVSTVSPNIHFLRPSVMPRDNIFTAMVAFLYQSDTSTNLWPSIHVFNSIGCHIGLTHSNLGQKKSVRVLSLVLCVSIIASTMFLKQHSVFDVVTAFLMAAVLYIIFYKMNTAHHLRRMYLQARDYLQGKRRRTGSRR